MSTAWSHLPNAVHIDRVLASVKAHPAEWAEAGSCTVVRNMSWYNSRDMIWDMVWSMARHAVWGATQLEARVALVNAAGHAARITAWDTAEAAIRALIAHDDCAHYLDMPSDKLRVWATLSENPAAVLLLPAVIAFEKINLLELA